MADYSLYTNDEEIPTEGFVLKKARAKSKSGTLTDAVQPGQSLLPNARAALTEPVDYHQRAADMFERGDQMYSKYLDTSEKVGEGAMLNALAAQFAGEGFAPLQAQMLKKAGAADDVQAKRAEFILNQAKAYATLAQTGDTARERLRAEQLAREKDREYKMLMAGIAQQGADTRALMAQNAALQQQNAIADRRDRQLNEGTQKLSKQTEDFTGLYSSVKQLNDTLKGYADRNESIPGIGIGANTMVATPFIGEDGRANRAMVQNVLNQIIRADSGQSVSAQEAARQILANMNGPMFSEKDFLNAWEKNLLPRVNESFANIGAGYSPEVKQRYRAQGGKIDFDKPFQNPRGTGLSVGTVRDGYKFKGGDPADKNNWEKQ